MEDELAPPIIIPLALAMRELGDAEVVSGSKVGYWTVPFMAAEWWGDVVAARSAVVGGGNHILAAAQPLGHLERHLHF